MSIVSLYVMVSSSLILLYNFPNESKKIWFGVSLHAFLNPLSVLIIATISFSSNLLIIWLAINASGNSFLFFSLFSNGSSQAVPAWWGGNIWKKS